MRIGFLVFCVVSMGCRTPGVEKPGPEVAANALAEVSSFHGLRDQPQRSQALFLEASKVLTHARCVNCHPADDAPRQGLEHRLHDPPIVRGADNRGVAGMHCGTCHQDQNLSFARVPGAPDWHLAPKSMAWLGRSPAAICEQLKDPARNGGKTLPQIVHHSAHDALVGWAWAPGFDREPAPGTQLQFGKLMQAWLDTGAVCPPGGAP